MRFLELLAHAKPTVLVFEDVHWASPLMAEFMWYVVANLDGVPLLGLATARPEMLQAHPGYEAVRAAGEHTEPARCTARPAPAVAA